MRKKKTNHQPGDWRAINPKDRGSIKWTSLMLPEHVRMIKEYDAMDGWTERPLLDEYEVVDLEARIQFAFESSEEVELRWWADGFTNEATGYVKKIDAIGRTIVYNSDGATLRLRFDDIVGIVTSW